LYLQDYDETLIAINSFTRASPPYGTGDGWVNKINPYIRIKSHTDMGVYKCLSSRYQYGFIGSAFAMSYPQGALRDDTGQIVDCFAIDCLTHS